MINCEQILHIFVTSKKIFFKQQKKSAQKFVKGECEKKFLFHIRRQIFLFTSLATTPLNVLASLEDDPNKIILYANILFCLLKSQQTFIFHVLLLNKKNHSSFNLTRFVWILPLRMNDLWIGANARWIEIFLYIFFYSHTSALNAKIMQNVSEWKCR